MKYRIAAIAAAIVTAAAAIAHAQTSQYFVEKLATNYTATIVSGTNAASGEILAALPAGQAYTRITVRPTGAPLVLNHGATASTNGSPVYGTGTNYTWTALDPVRGPFRTNSICARDQRAATNATTTAEVEAWYIDWR